MRTSTPTHMPRRRTRSREALIRAAQELVAERGTDVSTHDVAARAEVSPQTLYNHFPSKEALLAEAAADAIARFEDYLEQRTRDVHDPLEQLCVNMRLFGRIVDSHPQLAAVLAGSTNRALAGPDGFTVAAARHVAPMADSGLITPDDLGLALMGVVASTERLVALRVADPSIGPERADALAFQNLLLFGVPRSRALRLVGLPLPPWPRDGDPERAGAHSPASSGRP